MSGFSVPISLAVVINLGLIFQWNNQVPILESWISWLSLMIPNPNGTDLAIGLITTVVVFFALGQFVYSLRHVPIEITFRYVLGHRNTIILVSFSLSSSAIAAFHANFLEIYNLNVVFVWSLLWILLVGMTLYYYWLSKSLTIDGIVDTIASTIDLQKLIDISEDIRSNEIIIQSYYKENGKTKIAPLDEIHLIFSNELTLRSNKAGTSIGINLDKLRKVFESCPTPIEQIELGPKIGYYFPENHDALLRIVPKQPWQKGSEKKPKHILDLEDFLKRQSSKLEECFVFDDTLEGTLYGPFKDMLVIYERMSTDSPVEAAKLLNRISEVLSSSSLLGNNQIDPRIVVRALGNVIEQLNETGVLTYSDESAKNLTRILYSIRDHAFERGEVSIILISLSSIERLYFQALREKTQFSGWLSTYVLYVKELSGLAARISIDQDGKTKEELQKRWSYFYQPAIKRAIESATNAFYSTIRWSYLRPPEETRRYLIAHISQMFDFLDSVQHWNLIDEQIRQQLYSEYADELVYLAAFLFRNIVIRESLPPAFITEIGEPLILYCERGDVPLVADANNTLSRQFYSGEFERSIPFEGWEDEDVVGRATHLGRQINLGPFWAFVSVIFYFRQQVFPPRLAMTDAEVHHLTMLKNGLEIIAMPQYFSKIATMVNKNGDQLKKAISDLISKTNDKIEQSKKKIDGK